MSAVGTAPPRSVSEPPHRAIQDNVSQNLQPQYVWLASNGGLMWPTVHAVRQTDVKTNAIVEQQESKWFTGMDTSGGWCRHVLHKTQSPDVGRRNCRELGVFVSALLKMK